MPSGKYTCAVQWHIVLGGRPWPPEMGIFGVEPPQPKHAIPNCCCHLTNRKEAIPLIGKLLWLYCYTVAATRPTVAGWRIVTLALSSQCIVRRPTAIMRSDHVTTGPPGTPRSAGNTGSRNIRTRGREGNGREAIGWGDKVWGGG